MLFEKGVTRDTIRLKDKSGLSRKMKLPAVLMIFEKGSLSQLVKKAK